MLVIYLNNPCLPLDIKLVSTDWNLISLFKAVIIRFRIIHFLMFAKVMLCPNFVEVGGSVAVLTFRLYERVTMVSTFCISFLHAFFIILFGPRIRNRVPMFHPSIETRKHFVNSRGIDVFDVWTSFVIHLQPAIATVEAR